jgi:hypothetical protein
MIVCPETEKLKTVLDHLFNGLPCPKNIIQTITHWKSNYWCLAPHSSFDCDLLVSHFLKSKIADFMVVMFFDSFIENIEEENIKQPFLNDAEKLEIDRVKQFIVQSKLLPYSDKKDPWF